MNLWQRDQYTNNTYSNRRSRRTASDLLKYLSINLGFLHTKLDGAIQLYHLIIHPIIPANPMNYSEYVALGWRDLTNFGTEELSSLVVLTRAKVRFERVKDISKEVANLVAQRKIIGWFQGRMELGARALGSRSILSDPSDIDMKDRLNRYVKFREDLGHLHLPC